MTCPPSPDIALALTILCATAIGGFVVLSYLWAMRKVNLWILARNLDAARADQQLGVGA